jgi:hypothetical protein
MQFIIAAAMIVFISGSAALATIAHGRKRAIENDCLEEARVLTSSVADVDDAQAEGGGACDPRSRSESFASVVLDAPRAENAVPDADLAVRILPVVQDVGELA